MRPYFGLANEATLRGLSEKVDEERGVAYLRAVAEVNGLHGGDAYIGTNWTRVGTYSRLHARETLTALPHERPSKKRDVNGNGLTEFAHARWLHIQKSTDNHLLSDMADKRLKWFADRGEHGVLLSDEVVNLPSGNWEWSDAPPVYRTYEREPILNHQPLSADVCPGIFRRTQCACFNTRKQGLLKLDPIVYLGSYTLFAFPRKYKALSTYGGLVLDPVRAIERLTELSIDAEVLALYLKCLIEPAVGVSAEHDDQILQTRFDLDASDGIFDHNIDRHTNDKNDQTTS